MIDKTRVAFVGGSATERAALRGAIGRIVAEDEGGRLLECLAVWEEANWRLEIGRRYAPTFVAGDRLLQMPRDARVELTEKLAAMGIPMGPPRPRPSKESSAHSE